MVAQTHRSGNVAGNHPGRAEHRIAIVHSSSDNFAGSERVALQVAESVATRGDVPVFYLPGHGPFAEMLDDSGFEIRTFDFRPPTLRNLARRITVPWRVSRRLAKDGIDLVHCTSISVIPSFLPATRLRKIPLIAQLQTPYSGDDLHRSLCRHADLLLPITQAVAEPLHAYLPQKLRERVELLRPAIAQPDPGAAARGSDLRATWAVPSDAPAIGIVGQVIPRKGIDVLIRAIPELRAHGIAPDLFIVGDEPDPEGGYRHELQRLAEELGVAAQVKFCGPTDDVHAAYAALDIVAVPSRREGLGMVAGEALLGGAAVVASNTGGLPELIAHEKTGLLAPVDDPGALAGAIQRLLEDPRLRSRTIAEGQRHVRSHCTLEQFAARLRHLHERLLTPHAGHASGLASDSRRPDSDAETP